MILYKAHKSAQISTDLSARPFSYQIFMEQIIMEGHRFFAYVIVHYFL